MVPPSLPEDGSNSPRTKVAHRFHGLTLEGGGGVRATDPDPGHDAVKRHDSDLGVRKRVKLPLAGDAHIFESERPQQTPSTVIELAPDEKPSAAKPKAVQLPDIPAVQPPDDAPKVTTDDPKPRLLAAKPVPIRPAPPRDDGETGDSPTPRPISPSLLSAVKLRNSKRVGTPPPAPQQLEVVDPVRAALTWHEDEITIYDPDDSDDDGTGINGIGFKPTPAIAHARTIRRKQQLAEYRKREEREARARRSQRRRGSPAPSLVDLKGRVERRKVRFMESSQASAVEAG